VLALINIHDVRLRYNSARGIMWEGQDHLSDLDFADDIALIDDSWSSMQQTTTVGWSKKIFF